MREVLALAGSNIRWSWSNTDQIAIYGAVIAGIIMIFIQAVLIAVLAVFGQAQASDATSFFETPAEYVTTDVALIFLEQVFGPNLDIFGAASQPLGTPVYAGIHAILSLYSLAMMVIAVIIVVYYIMTVVGEAAQSGTPFGKRFNSLWAPIRLLAALGLLVPLGSGLNSAQYLTLWLAKMGSGLGTQVWSVFVEEITAATDIVSKPTGESTSALVQRIFLNEVCAASYNQVEETSSNSIKILQVTGRRSSVVPDFANPANMVTAAREAGQEAVVLSWSLAEPGERATDYACGRISVSLSEFNAFSDGETVTIAEERWWWSVPFIGPDMDERLGTIHENVKSAYLREIKAISDAVRPSAEAIAAVKISVNRKPEFGDESTLEDAPTADGATGVADILRAVGQSTQDNINTTIQATYESITGSEYVSTGGYEEMQRRGWGAAGLWYGTLGTINKKYMDAIASAVPTLDTLFEASEVQENERGALGWLFGISRFDLSGSATTEIEQTITYASDAFAGVVRDIAPGTSPLYEDARYIEADAAGEGGWFGKTLVTMMGGRQVLSVKNDPDLDPMVRLAATGHNMITRSLWAAGFGAAFGIGGAVLATLPNPVAKFGGEAIGAVSVLLFVFAGIALTAGIFLAYVLPLIPFVYFAFAVIGWILEIFEAIVAMPLWALAHLRIDGDGMPGQAAIGGYQLLLMILLRPALIVMGLVGGYVIFGAAVYYFSVLFNSATAITQGHLVSSALRDAQKGSLSRMVY